MPVCETHTLPFFFADCDDDDGDDDDDHGEDDDHNPDDHDHLYDLKKFINLTNLAMPLYDIFHFFPHSHPLVHGSFYTTETGLRPLDLSAPSPDTPGQGQRMLVEANK